MSEEGENPEVEVIGPSEEPARKCGDYTGDDLILAIARHVAENGHKNWGELFARLGVETPTDKRRMWRYIAKVREGKFEVGHDIAMQIRQAKAAAKKMRLESAAKHVPAAPSPNVIATKGPEVLRHVDYMGQIRQMVEDIDMLREFSLAYDATGKAKIKNPMYFGKSIQLRMGAIETALKAMQEIWDLRKMQEFYETIIATIGEADPHIAKKIMEKLVSLNAERGFTTDAKIG